MIRYLARVFAVGVLVLLGLAGPAGADAAGPTDYRSEILSIEPAVPGLSVRIVGGDSFVMLEVEPGLEVTIIGYQGEDYLRVLASGLVQENQRSPSHFLNEERYGDADLPPEASSDAEPEWLTVDDDGSWAWHDHRTHWMSPKPPPGASRGDQIVEGVIPLVVDGETVVVSVGSYWLESPSPIMPMIGLLVGAGVSASALAGKMKWDWLAIAPVLILAFVVGAWQVFSLPPETGPSLLNIVWPLVGLLALASLPMVQETSQRLLAVTLMLVGAVSLVSWGFMRRGFLFAAILPTEAPAGLDRITTALALVVGAGMATHLVRTLFKPDSLGT